MQDACVSESGIIACHLIPLHAIQRGAQIDNRKVDRGVREGDSRTVLPVCGQVFTPLDFSLNEDETPLIEILPGGRYEVSF